MLSRNQFKRSKHEGILFTCHKRRRCNRFCNRACLFKKTCARSKYVCMSDPHLKTDGNFRNIERNSGLNSKHQAKNVIKSLMLEPRELQTPNFLGNSLSKLRLLLRIWKIRSSSNKSPSTKSFRFKQKNSLIISR